MTAYVISEVEIIDQTAAAQYRALAAKSIATYGGRYLIRAANPEVPEGRWPEEQRVVVVEFPTMERIHEWYHSAEYARALTIRGDALERRLLFVEGV